MNKDQSGDNAAIALPINEGGIEIKGEGTRRLDGSRIAVLNGWIISMLGIALYCYAMLGSGEAVDPFSSILERGWVGGGAIALLVIGVLLWIYGGVTFLLEVEKNAPEGYDPSF